MLILPLGPGDSLRQLDQEGPNRARFLQFSFFCVLCTPVPLAPRLNFTSSLLISTAPQGCPQTHRDGAGTRGPVPSGSQEQGQWRMVVVAVSSG